MPALAITDTNNLFGALEFSEKLAKSGVQPIIGAQIDGRFRRRGPRLLRGVERDNARAPIVLLAQNEAGYRNLMRLVSALWLDPTDGDEAASSVRRARRRRRRPHRAHRRPRRADRPGAESGTWRPRREPAQAPGRASSARGSMSRSSAMGSTASARSSLSSSRLADRLGLPLVATNEPYFAAPSDYEAHDALLCVAEGALVSTSERRRLSPEHRFKTRAEMTRTVRRSPRGDRGQRRDRDALRLSAADAKADPAALFGRRTARPSTRSSELRRQASEGLRARLAAHGLAPGRAEEDYAKRLAFELDVIVNMKFAGYFLIVADFIQWAKAQGIPVGPGRGSGAGSLVAWALTITDLDPLRFGLLFERFLNPERISMPDFDIDFCQERRDEVIAYVRERYGADRVAQIITFGSFLARGVLRNVGRVLEMPLGQVDKLAKLVPQNPAHPVTLKQAVADEPRLQEAAKADEKVAADAGDRRAARGALFQRLDPCRRRRHRRPAADRARAALPRSEIGDAGDPVQHEMGRAGRAW